MHSASHAHHGASTAAALLLACGAAAQGLAELPAPQHGRALLFSSADPAGGNEDHTHCLRRLPDGTCVLAEVEGPGRVVRVWSANPAGDLRVEVDGRVAFAGPFAALFDGSRPPFVPPLSGPFAGGALCHVPIPFRERLRVTASPVAGRYHQITVLLQEEPEAFAAPPGPRLAADLEALAAGARQEGEVAMLTGLPLRDGQRLLGLPGAGEVLELGARVRGVDPRLAWLQVRCEGEAEPCLSAPLDLLVPDDLATEVGGGAGPLPALPSLRLPMPFRRGLSLRVALAGEATPAARLDVRLRWRALPPDHGRRWLHGRVSQGTNVHGRPARLLERHGSGHLAGVVAELQGAPAQHLSFLEGDESIVADGRPWQGTGTEDFFSGAWYFRGAPAGSAFAAVGAIDHRRARVRCARWFVADPVPFAGSLQVDLEHGGGNDTPGSVWRALVFSYADGPRGAAGIPAPPPSEPAPQWREVRAADLWPGLAPGGGAVAWTGDEGPQPAGTRGEQQWTLWLGGARVDPAARPLRFDRVRIEPVLPALRQWRVLGPFACEQRRGLDTVGLPPEAELAGGGLAVTADAAGFVDLWRLFPRDGAVAFAIAEFEVAAAGEGVLVLGSDDAVRAFVDGRAVHEHRGLRGVGRDQDRVPLRLEAGRHRLVLQVENYRGGFGCCARLEGLALR